MKWVTRDFVHLDRVASPWLIKRFVDRDAVFVFVPWDHTGALPADATPLALPGAELGPHDAQGTTFEKIVAKYKFSDPAIIDIARIIHLGVDYVLKGYRPGANDRFGQIAVGLLATAEGILLLHDDDARIIEASLPVYDALYANLRAHHLLHQSGEKLPESKGLGPTLPTRFLRELLRKNA